MGGEDVTEKLLSLRDAAERLDVHPRTLLRWIREGRLPGARKIPGRFGGEWRIPEGDLDKLTRPGRIPPDFNIAEAPRCQAVKADGTPCQAPALKGRRFCRWHQDRETEP